MKLNFTKSLKKDFLKLLCFLTAIVMTNAVQAQEYTGPWDLDVIKAVPNFETTTTSAVDGLESIFYESIDYKGEVSKVYAYYGLPSTPKPENGYPAVVLVHGGGGTAYDDWVKLWNDRGFVAISMDLEGHIPSLDDSAERATFDGAGPARTGVFHDNALPIDEQWYYHAVAQIIKAHSLIASFDEVDATKIGIAGVSWGGMLTSTVAGLDLRFKFAIPIYGCGFLKGTDGHMGNSLASTDQDYVNNAMTNYEASAYLHQATMPMLFMNGANDAHFPLPATMDSKNAIQGDAYTFIKDGFGHGHSVAWNEEESYIFADRIINGGTPLLEIDVPAYTDGTNTMSVNVTDAGAGIQSATFYYTTDRSEVWSSKTWSSMPATVNGATVSAVVPDNTYASYFLITDNSTFNLTSDVHRFKSSDASISGLKVGESTIENFDAGTSAYTFELPYSTSALPAITAITNDYSATVEVTAGEELPTTATVVITSEDGTQESTYTIALTMASEEDVLFSYYEDGQSEIAEVSYILMTQDTEAQDPTLGPCSTANLLTRLDGRYANVAFTIDGKIDFSEATHFKIRMYVEDPGKTLTNNECAIALRQDNESATQYLLNFPIEKFDEWVDYTIEVNPNAFKEEVEYMNTFYFFPIINDLAEEGGGMKFYIDKIQGPKILQDQVKLKGETSDEGKMITISAQSHTPISNIENPEFQLMVNNVAVGIERVKVKNQIIELILEETVKAGQAIQLTFTGGTITDELGNSIAVNTILPVENNTSADHSLYSLYNVGGASILDFAFVSSATVDENAQNPDTNGYPEEIVAKYVREDRQWSEMRWDLPAGSQFDFTSTKTVSIKVYVEDTGIENLNKNVQMILKKDNDSPTQKSLLGTLRCLDTWQEYQFDFSNFTTEELEGYNSISFYFGANDSDPDFTATGMVTYFDDLRGPKVISDNIITSLNTDVSGGKVVMDVVSLASLASIENAVFELKVNGSAVAHQVVELENTIEFRVEEPISYGSDVTLSYVSGTITDQDEKTLSYFNDREVINRAQAYTEIIYYNDGSDNENLSFFNPYKVVTSSADNPSLTGISQSARVTKVVKEENAHSQVQILFNGHFETDIDKVVKLKVYQETSDDGLYSDKNSLRVRLRNNSNNANITLSQDILVQDQWVEYTFDFKDLLNDGDIFDQMIIFFGQDASPFNGNDNVYYIDNVKGPRVSSDDDKRLSALIVDGEGIEDFSSDQINYAIELPYGYEGFPNVVAKTVNGEASYEVIHPETIPGSTAVRVTAKDNSTLDYNLSFNIAIPSNDATITELLLDDVLINGFSADVTEYNVEYPYGSTNIPTVTAEANDDLASLEVTNAVALPGKAEVTVTAQSGIEKVYTVNFTVTPPSDDNTLSTLLVDGTLIADFDASTESYTIELPYGSTEIPVVTATKNNATASLVISETTELPGASTVIVTAQSGAEKVYIVNFTYTAPSEDNTLSELLVDGTLITDFDASTESYTIELPYGSTEIPVVTATLNDETASLVISETTELPGSSTVTVTAQSGAEKVYTVNFTYTAPSEDNTLSALLVNGNLIADFDASTESYTIELPFGTIEVPVVTATKNDETASLSISETTELPGTSTVTVTAQSGAEKVYTVNFTITSPSEDNSLTALLVDGTLITGFDPLVQNYTIELPYGTTVTPVVTATKNSETTTLVIEETTELPGTTTVTVTAQNGAEKVYSVIFEVADPSTNTNLTSLSVDGETVENFDPAVLQYTVALPMGTSEVPHLSAVLEDENASYTIENTTVLPGQSTVTVVAEDGETQAVYVVEFIYDETLSSNASLKELLLDNTLIEGFDADVVTYTVHLPYASSVPVVTASAVHDMATVTVGELSEDNKVLIEVLAEDQVTIQEYSIQFTFETASSNANLTDILIGGTSLEGFKIDSLNYSYQLTSSVIPSIEAVLEDELADVEISEVTEAGKVAIITVTAQDGVTKSVYSILFLENQEPPLSVEEELANIKVYKMNNRLHISADQPLRGKQIVISDVQGRVILATTIQEERFNTQIVENGLLIIQILGDNCRYIKKVVF
ncbi:alpha/beta hydrolase family protein [Flammeovirga aprica]|uniref:Prolyl oligopeptidase family serine peptidase n=1 Tax=Flammeovirga aprica JL-4 TaxID=694437 RepID=A0A7X9P3P5_9BACT|nr:acetylxylan esterase [Flammeovirga aprica]NME68728.1 prolyl oligopeptidase family serine peptidase [Flammeovirga aprica JL-4]